jgi:hypothetical protein
LPTLFLVQTGLFINNEFVAGDSQIETINPANGKVIAKVEAGMFHHKSLTYMFFPPTPFFLMPVFVIYIKLARSKLMQLLKPLKR